MNELHLFAGAGGGILGGMLLGHTTVCAVEIEHYCREVLLQRQRDGILPWFPIWDDVRTFDGKPWRGIADVVCGGFPCQDISIANNRGKGPKGLDGERSGLWGEMFRVVCEVRPRRVFVENSPMLTVRGLERVLRDLAEAGYSSKWVCLRGSDFGANHYRERIWIYSDAAGFDGKTCKQENRARIRRIQAQYRGISWWKTEPDILRVDDGLAPNVDRRNKAIGNGQISAMAAFAWEILTCN